MPESRPPDRRPRPRPRRWFTAAFVSALGALILTAGLVAAGTPVTNGFRDFAYGGGAFRATADGAQSKLWFAGGKWWGGLFVFKSAPGPLSEYRIHRLDGDTWVQTSTQLDTRDESHADYLYDAASSKLYVLSAGVPQADCPDTVVDDLRLYRYSFNGTAYSLDAGYPVIVDPCGGYTATIAKDSTGTLWAAWPRGVDVRVARTSGGDATWSSSYRMPVQATDLTPHGGQPDPDTTAVIAFGGNKIGVAWTNHQAAPAAVSFAVHADGGGDDAAAWGTTAETALGQSGDDHINLKTDPDGNVWMVNKTGLDGDPVVTKPLIQLLQRSSGGTWTAHLVSTVADLQTRPQLAISNTSPRIAYVLMTAPNGGGVAYYKSAPLSGPEAFKFVAGDATTSRPGVPFIKSATEVNIDDVTTTKQLITPASGLVVEASDRLKKMYFHNRLPIAASDSFAPNGTVTINGGAAGTKTRNVSVAVPATDSGSSLSLVRLANSSSVDGSGLLNGAGATTYTYTTPIAWTLTAGDGVKTVYAQWRDGAGNWSSVKSDTIRLDTTGPTGSVSIAGGAATTSLATVSVSVPATDPSGVTEVRLSNTAATSGGLLTNGTTMPYASSVVWTLTSGNGTKTVYVQWKDSLGNWSGVTSDSIVLDSPDTTFTAITPVRLLDTRVANPAGIKPFVHGQPQSFQITGRGGIPANAVAVTGNLTVVGQGAAGYVSLGPLVGSAPGTSTLNFPLGDIRANGVTVPLSSTGALQAVYVASAGKSTHLVMDVTGYFVKGTTGSRYQPVTPARFLDTRVNNPAGAAMLRPSIPYAFKVGGRTVAGTAIPSDAVAITGNLTVTGQTKAGYLSLTPTSQTNPTTSTLNFPVKDVRANNVTVPLGTNGNLWVVYKGSGQVHAVLDVTGYFRAGSSGLTYVPLSPARIIDTRIALGIDKALVDDLPRTMVIRNAGGIASDSKAFTGNLTVTRQTHAGYVSVTPTAIVNPTTSTINFPVKDVRANGFATPIDDATGRSAFVFKAKSGTVHIVVDITGYFH
ncbi:MAG: hypothetical protein WEG56_06065 [Chloroflexota bacterium]